MHEMDKALVYSCIPLEMRYCLSSAPGNPILWDYDLPWGRREEVKES